VAGDGSGGGSRSRLQNKSAGVTTTQKREIKLTYRLGGIAPPSPLLLLLVASVAVRDGPWAHG